MLAPVFKITNKIRLIELFAGVGSQAMSIRDLGIDFEHYKVVEFDKYAIKSYNAIHDTNFETSDIKGIHASDLGVSDDDYTYIMTYSFPCQDLSKAGKQKGMEKGSNTRSGLLWEVERILDEMRGGQLPQVLLMENVPDVIGTKNIKHFQDWRLKLEQLGYSNFVECLNAKNYGIPQNRNRCFMVSILGDYYYEFPKQMPLELRLKDLLEPYVDEKYYLSENQISYFEKHSKECEEKGNGFRFKTTDGNAIARTCTTHPSGLRMDDNFVKVARNTNPSGNGMNGNVYEGNISPTLTTNKGEGIKMVVDGTLSGGKWDTTNESCRRVYSIDGIIPTITTMGGGNQEPKITEPVICASRGINPLNPKSRKSGEHVEQMIEINHSGCSNTLTTVQKDNLVFEAGGGGYP